MSDMICECGHPASMHLNDFGCDTNQVNGVYLCQCSREPMDFAREEITALKAEVERWNALEKVRADFLEKTIGMRSLERFVVKWKELEAENARLTEAFSCIVAAFEKNGTWADIVHDIVDIARAAQEPKP